MPGMVLADLCRVPSVWEQSSPDSQSPQETAGRGRARRSVPGAQATLPQAHHLLWPTHPQIICFCFLPGLPPLGPDTPTLSVRCALPVPSDLCWSLWCPGHLHAHSHPPQELGPLHHSEPILSEYCLSGCQVTKQRNSFLNFKILLQHHSGLLLQALSHLLCLSPSAFPSFLNIHLLTSEARQTGQLVRGLSYTQLTQGRCLAPPYDP